MDYMDLRPGKKILWENEPYEVVSAEFSRKQQRKAVVKGELRHLFTGRTLQKTFQVSDSFDEAPLDTISCQYLYRSGDDFTFMDMKSFDQFMLTKEQVGAAAKYMKDGLDVDVVRYKEQPVSVTMPKKVDLKVVDAPPGVRGDTANSATRPVILETGHKVQAPLFIVTGDVIRINTETDTYVERA